MKKTKTLKQIRLLLSRTSPLSKAQKQQLKAELDAGEIRVVKK